MFRAMQEVAALAATWKILRWDGREPVLSAYGRDRSGRPVLVTGRPKEVARELKRLLGRGEN